MHISLLITQISVESVAYVELILRLVGHTLVKRPGGLLRIGAALYARIVSSIRKWCLSSGYLHA